MEDTSVREANPSYSYCRIPNALTFSVGDLVKQSRRKCINNQFVSVDYSTTKFDLQLTHFFCSSDSLINKYWFWALFTFTIVQIPNYRVDSIDRSWNFDKTKVNWRRVPNFLLLIIFIFVLIEENLRQVRTSCWIFLLKHCL